MLKSLLPKLFILLPVGSRLSFKTWSIKRVEDGVLTAEIILNSVDFTVSDELKKRLIDKNEGES